MARFKKVSADEAHSMRKDHVRAIGGSEAVIKGAAWKAPASWDKDKRSARFVMTSEGVDRYGDIVGQAGMDTTRFMDNPQGLVFHNSRSWPIGKWTDVTKNLTGRPKRTEGTLVFLPEGVEEDADRAARHVAAGSIRTVSIGFIPSWDDIEMILDDDEEWMTGLKFNKSELIECSLVPIPANPDALGKDVGGDFRLAKGLIEDILDGWSRSPEGVLMPKSVYEKAYKTIVEKIAADTIEADADVELTVEELAVEDGTETMPDPECAVEDEEEKAVEGVRDEPAKKWAKPSAEKMSAFVKDAKADDNFVWVMAREGYRTFELQIQRDGDKIASMVIDGTREQIDSVVNEALGLIHSRDAAAGEEARTINEQRAAADLDPLRQKLEVELNLDLDTTGLDKATDKVTALGALVDSVMSKMATLFGRKAVEAEPVIETPAPPSPEEMAAAQAKALELRQRLIAKGLIEA